MRKICLLILSALFFLPCFAGANEKNPTPETLVGVTVVSVDTVKQWLDRGDDVLILDARKSGDFEEGHLPEALHTPVPTDLNIEADTIARSVTALEGIEEIKTAGKETKLVAYCNGAA